MVVCARELVPFRYRRQDVKMEADAILFGIGERPTPPSFLVELLTVPAMIEESLSHHELYGAGVRMVFGYQQLTDEVDVVVGFYTAPYGPHDRADSKRPLWVYAGDTHTPGVLTVFQPTPNRLVALDGVSVLTWRNINRFRNALQKPGVLRSVNFHGVPRSLLCCPCVLLELSLDDVSHDAGEGLTGIRCSAKNSQTVSLVRL